MSGSRSPEERSESGSRFPPRGAIPGLSPWPPPGYKDGRTSLGVPK